MRVRAFAKINRSLRVLGVRPDGFHELRTVFQSIALHDTLTIRAVHGPFQLTCDNPDCPSDEGNLIWQAAEQVWKAARRRGAPRDVSIHLAKQIPLQAGLGGGSSDAAAALRALGRLWRVDAGRVRAIAPSLGADVPYFLEGGTVLGLERGDELFPLIDAPRAWVVLAIPAFGVSTKEAFAWFDADGARRLPAAARGDGARALARHAEAPEARRRQPSGLRLPKGVALHERETANDLQGVVAQRHPEITQLVRALRRAGATDAAMSGSGSAVFGLFSTRRAAVAAVVSVSASRRRVLITRTVDRATCQALAAN
jgi:4-diphosphocytidyl-2-C-methyl-D-erythritol kinase